MRLKLVQFHDGTYGIRRGLFLYEYLNLQARSNYWWSRRDHYFYSCKADFGKAMDAYKKLMGSRFETVIDVAEL